MRYIGVSRGIQQTLRLNLTRRPKETYYFKVCCRCGIVWRRVRCGPTFGCRVASSSMPASLNLVM